MSLHSPLGRFFGLLADESGTGHFWGQRLSAIFLAFLGPWFVFSLMTMPELDHPGTIAFIAAPLNNVLLLLLSLTLAYHSYLGVQVVIDDYVHVRRIRVFSLILSRLAHSMLTVTSVYAILKIGFGA
jgi:succinate dehydrogenase / fumarate reductase membrane anchor subunit